MTRLALSALLATLALFGAAPLALAHTELVSSDPANGATLPQRPTRVTLTFSEPVPAESATVTVTGPDGAAWPLGEITAEGNTLVVPLRESGSPAGPHTLNWKVESLDGDFVDGALTFTVPAPPAGQPPATTPAGTGTPPPAPTPATTGATATPTTDSAAVATSTAVDTTTSSPAADTAARDDDGGGGVPVWVWIVGALVLLGAGVAAALALGRRRAEEADGGPTPGDGVE